MEYTWTISALDCIVDVDGLSNVISTVHWRYVGTDEDEITAEVYGALPFPLPVEADFIPFSEITTAQVIEWLEASMSNVSIEGEQTQLEKYKASILEQITLAKNPVMVTLHLEN
jgi:hypothetical protein